jgi:hypothetical protein
MPLPAMEKAFAESSVNTDKRRNKDELAAFMVEFEYVSEETHKKGIEVSVLYHQATQVQARDRRMMNTRIWQMDLRVD